MREDAAQTWPEFTVMPMMDQKSAVSMSASSKTIAGLLPPSSRVTRFKLLLVAASWILRPVLVDPVKEILAIFMWLASIVPVVPPPFRTRCK